MEKQFSHLYNWKSIKRTKTLVGHVRILTALNILSVIKKRKTLVITHCSFNASDLQVIMIRAPYLVILNNHSRIKKKIITFYQH